jgi:hypothetical protein
MPEKPREDIEVIHEPISEAEFFDRFVKNGGKPVLMKGFAKNWPAFELWTPEYFKQSHGDRKVRVGRLVGETLARKNLEFKTITVAEYLQNFEADDEPNPFYLRDWFVPQICYTHFSMPHFSRSWHHRIPFIGRSMFSWMYIGKKGTFTPLHTDVFTSHAYNVVVSGLKEWVFIPKADKDKLYGNLVHPFEPDLEKHPLFSSARRIHCLQEPGDLVFTPGDWIHAVRNLKAGIAMTENFFVTREWRRTLKYAFPTLVMAIALTIARRK